MAKTSSPSVVYGQHRSLALAERHRRELEREYGGKWRITRRENARGELSSRGHFFTFRKVQRRRKPKTEYQINVAYDQKRGPQIQIQIAAIGPSNQTREQVLEVVEHRMYEEEELPGWKLHIVFWEKLGKQSFGTDELAWTRLAAIYPHAEKIVRDKKKDKEL